MVVSGLRDLANGEPTSAGVTIFASMAVAQTVGLIGWPVFVSLSKGNGVETDFGWRFEKVDLPLGVAVGVASLVIVFVVTSLIGIGLDFQIWGRDTASETATGPVGFGMWVVIFMFAVVAAPLGEEVFFRGLVMRTLQSKYGAIPAVVGSTALFTLLHLTTPDLAVAAVTMSGIAIVGLALSVLAMRTGRLGAAVVAHGTYNFGILLIELIRTA